MSMLCRIAQTKFLHQYAIWLLPSSKPLAFVQYEKGELEQKNISCLMPQPFSGRHNR